MPPSELSALASETGAVRTLIAANTTLGRAHAALHHPAEARAAFEQAIAAVEQFREHVAGADQDRGAFLARCIDPYEEMIALDLAEGEPEAALAMAERAKARVLLEVLRTGRADIHKEMTPSELAQEVRLRRRLVTLNAQIEQDAGPRADRTAAGAGSSAHGSRGLPVGSLCVAPWITHAAR